MFTNKHLWLVPLLIITSFVVGFRAFSQQMPLLTVRFANPDYDCSTQTYCLDVEFQCDTPNKQLFGMNVRFFYPHNLLEYLSMGEFQGAYGPESPNPPLINTGNDSSGPGMFGFAGPAVFVNGAVQLHGSNNPIYISTTGWTKLFNICFHVVDPEAPYSDNFCPSVIWDLEVDPANGGFLPGDQGIVMSVVAPPPNESAPASVDAVQFNWTYDNPPDPPYGYPLNETCLSTRVAPKTKIDSTVALPNDYVTLAVRVWHFSDISSFTLTLDYNPAVLDYCCSTPDAGIAENFSAVELYAGRLQLASSMIVTGYTNGSALMYLTFTFSGGVSSLSWYNSGAACQYVNANTGLQLYDSPTEAFYTNGNVSTGQFVWTGAASTNWNLSNNWQSNLIPGRFDDVIVNSTPMPANWPEYAGNFAMGTQCRNITINGSARLIITGDLAISPGHKLSVTETGLLKVGGNWLNSGTFIPGMGTVEFTSPTPGAITGGVLPGNYVAAFVLSTFTQGMTAVSGAAAGPAGDNAHSDVNIGFTFNYLGVNYTQVRINTNGWLSLNLTGSDATSADNSRLYNTLTPSTVLAPWWDDLKADGSATISYLTQGISPNRIFIAEWKNILAYSYGADARLNFQVKLYETTGIIEFCYGNVAAGSHNVNEGASVGIKDASGGPGNFKEAGYGTSNLMIACLLSNPYWPAVNYRFTPPQVNTIKVFNKITVSSSAPLNIGTDVIITGSE
jgi:hypothetical protein